MIIEHFAVAPLGCNCVILGDEERGTAIVVERSYQRSYRRCPKHSEHYEIALWFRELASAGEWGQFRHD